MRFTNRFRAGIAETLDATKVFEELDREILHHNDELTSKLKAAKESCESGHRPPKHDRLIEKIKSLMESSKFVTADGEPNFDEVFPWLLCHEPNLLCRIKVVKFSRE